VKQVNSLVGAWALGGVFWEMLTGLLFFLPGMGVAIGSITGALAGEFSDCGIDDDFVKEVGESICPGDSALFLLTTSGGEDKIVEAVRDGNIEVLHTNLSIEEENVLREAFGAEVEHGSGIGAAATMLGGRVGLVEGQGPAGERSDDPASDVHARGVRRVRSRRLPDLGVSPWRQR
jgi:uncharacterized membrane protein